MRIITKKTLFKFSEVHPAAKPPLERWLAIMKTEAFNNFQELRKSFPNADKVGNCTVFNIGGNQFRLITAIHYNRQIIYLRQVLTHAEYDLNQWQEECKK